MDELQVPLYNILMELLKLVTKAKEDPSVRAKKEERIYVMQNDGSGNAVHVWVSSRRGDALDKSVMEEQRMAGFRAGSDMILKNEERLPKEVRAPTAESGAISHRASSISFQVAPPLPLPPAGRVVLAQD